MVWKKQHRSKSPGDLGSGLGSLRWDLRGSRFCTLRFLISKIRGLDKGTLAPQFSCLFN